MTKTENTYICRLKLKTHTMRKITFFALMAVMLGACNNGPKFTVMGEVTGAEGKSVYLEASQLGGIVMLDSVKLNAAGKYTFKSPRPESPEFYRLRVENKFINFAIDSTETLTINAPFDNFSTAYTVEGSPESVKMKELTLKQIKLQNNVVAINKLLQERKLSSKAHEDSLKSLIDTYKADVKKNYIFAAPNSTAAYYALFQRLGSYMIFDPATDREDIKCFAAVATSLEAFYPDAERSKNLYNLVIKGLKSTRAANATTLEIPEDMIQEATLIDINLRDLRGNQRKLTDLVGKVVLLDFTVYQHAASGERNLMLRELYNKYADRGLEIYQISYDPDEHFWKTSADNLPWICVRDPQGNYSPYLGMYYVQQLPAYFLINRANELFMRGDAVEDLEKTIQSLL